MPTIAFIDGVKVLVYYNDHATPHFHSIFVEHEVQIAIRTLRALRGPLPATRLRRVLSLAKDHQG